MIKELIRPIISYRLVNLVVVSILKVVKPLVPMELLVRVPIYGRVTCGLADSKALTMYSQADDVMVSGLCFQGLESYEQESIDLFRGLASSSSLILDVGANTGIYSLVAAIENPLSKVYAFEPVPRIFNRLEKNRDINNATNVQLNQAVIADFDGSTTLYIPTGKIPTSSSTAAGHRRAVQTIEVNATTLDSFIELEGISKVDLMKIDTESTEPLVLDGALKMIERDRPAIICEVLRPRTGGALRKILDKFGYQYYWITPSGLIKQDRPIGDPEFKYLNYLFIQPDKISKIEAQIISA
ncbi:FkbM family methyltransferase [bacterium]|nr:FkbM family methyltransferase [bacterium]